MPFPQAMFQEVRRRRKEAGLSQTDLALHAGVGRRFVSELEGGKTSVQLDKVLAVLAVFGLSLDLVRPLNGADASR